MKWDDRAVFFFGVMTCWALSAAEADLEEQFIEPSKNATRPGLALTLDPSQEADAALDLQIERAHVAGAGGVLLSLSAADERSGDRLRSAALACQRLGMELGVCDFAVSTQAVPSVMSARKMVWSSVSVCGEAPVGTNARPQVCQTGDSYELLARLAVPVAETVEPHQILDLAQGAVPTGGTWRIYEFGHVDQSPRVIDCFNEPALFKHVNQQLVAFQKSMERTYGTTFLWYQFSGLDGSELTWPRDLPAAFLKRSGLNLMRYLPTLAGVAVGGETTAAHVRQQVRQTIREEWRRRFATTVNELVHEAGLDAGIRVDGVPIDPEEVSLYFKRPMLVSARTEAQHIANVLAAGGARTQRRRYVVGQLDARPVAATEATSLLTFPWKREMDALFCDGVTRILLDTAGELAAPNDSSVSLRDACRYAHRCQTVLQQGEAVADFLVWAPKPLAILDGYGCDYANEAMLEAAVIRGGCIRFASEQSYGRLVVSGVQVNTKAAQRLLRSFADQGVKVWIAGDVAPDDGAKAPGQPLKAASESGLLPDFVGQSSDDSPLQVRFVHRRVGGLEIYFMVNVSENGGVLAATFRDTGKGDPVRWDPSSGETGTLRQGVERLADGRMKVPVFLAPYDACFIVFER